MSTTWSHPTDVNGASSADHVVGGAPRSLGARPAAGSVTEEFVVEHPMTPEDVAELLRIDRETVYRMARRGELPGFKVSSRWRFLPSRLQRWMEDQERQLR